MGQFTERTTREVMNFIDDRVHNMSDAERRDAYTALAEQCAGKTKMIIEAERDSSAADMMESNGGPPVRRASPADQDPDTWERSTNIADALVEDGDNIVYFGVKEFYVGLHESSGGKGLRTTRYEFYVNCEGAEGDGMQVRMPITPWEMVSIGQTFLNGGVKQLREQLTALANKIDQQVAKEKI